MKNINTKDWESECKKLKNACEYWKIAYDRLGFECECYKSEYEYWQNACEYWQKEWKDLENKYKHLEGACKKLDAAQDSYKALLDMVTRENNENTNMTKSLIDSLLKTNTLASKQKTYLMYDDETQKFMIGKSNDPYKTEKELYLCRCSIYMVAYCDYDVVSVLHSMYSENRVKDEWFNLSTKQVSWIINHFGMKATNRSKLNEFYDKR